MKQFKPVTCVTCGAECPPWRLEGLECPSCSEEAAAALMADVDRADDILAPAFPAAWPWYEVDPERDAERYAVAVWLGVCVREWPSGVIAAAA